jgi:uncharacterized protein DUF4112
MAQPVFTRSIRGEVLLPLADSSPIFSTSNEHLNYIAAWLDDRFSIPGTKIRFGLDALIGWIPGLGDALAAFASVFIVFAAWRRGAARITILRMLVNLTFETTLGAIPVIGDFAHVAWKANRRNYNLLIRDQQSSSRQTWQDWFFVITALLVVLALFACPLILLIHLLRSHRLF